MNNTVKLSRRGTLRGIVCLALAVVTVFSASAGAHAANVCSERSIVKSARTECSSNCVTDNDAPCKADFNDIKRTGMESPKKYLRSYEYGTIVTKNGTRALLRLTTDQKLDYNDTTNKWVYEGESVTVIARQNGCALVIVSPGVGGWVKAELIDYCC